MGGGHHLDPAERFPRVLDREGRILARLDATGGEVIRDLDFLSETELIVTSDGGLRWWNSGTGDVRLLKDGSHGGIAVSEHFFLTCADDGFWLYDRQALTGRMIDELDRGGTAALAIAPDESFVVTGDDRGRFWVRHLDQDRPHFVTGPGGRILTLQIDPHGRWITALTGEGLLAYWPVPRGRPLHDRPLGEFLAVLEAQTNVRVVVAPDAPSGYREIAGRYPGWRNGVTWQEWYSDAYRRDPPWRPRVDLEAVRAGGR